jgi:hypothetical protein
MANHLRRQIREAAATTVTGLSTTGARVYQMRAYPLQDAELPGLLVFTKDETAERMTLPAPSIMERRLELVIEAYAKANSDLEDTLDGIAKEVEIAMAANPGLTGTAKSTTLRSSEVEVQDGAENPIGMLRLVYEVLYFARETAPDVGM